MAPALGCWSVALRASFVSVAVPLLLVGSLFSEVALQLQVQSERHLKYAAGEETTAAGLEGMAGKSAAAAVEDETEAIALSAQAARLNGQSLEEEKNAIEQRGEKAGGGIKVDSEAVMGEEGKDLQAAVDAAAQDAAAPDSAADAFKAALEADASGGADAAAVAVEAGEAADAGEAVAAGAIEGDSLTVGGPLGLAIATAGVTAAVEAPKAVSALKGVATQYKADRDEVVAAGDQQQAAGLEADTLVEEDGAAASQSAASKEVAVAGAYFMSAQVFQMLAFAFEAPVALVVLSQWFFGAGAVILGAKQCDSVVSATGAIAGTLSLAAAVGSLLVSPWAETVLYAAHLEDQDPDLKVVSQLPHLIEKAMPKTEEKHHHKGAELDMLLRERRLEEMDWLHQAEGMADNIEKQAKKGLDGTEKVIAKEAPVVGAAMKKGADQLKTETAQAIKKGAPVVGELSKDVQQGTSQAVDAAEKAIPTDVKQQASQVVGAAERAIPKNVKDQAAQAASQVTNNVQAASQAASQATEQVVHTATSKDNQLSALRAALKVEKDVQTGLGEAAGEISKDAPVVGKATEDFSKHVAQGASQVAGEISKDLKKEKPAIDAAATAISKNVQHDASQVKDKAEAFRKEWQNSQQGQDAERLGNKELHGAQKIGGQAAGAITKGAQQGQQLVNQVVGNIVGSVPQDVKQRVSGTVGAVTNASGKVLGIEQNLQNGAMKTADGAINQAVKAVPQNVKSGVKAGLQNTQHGVSSAAQFAENLAAGKPNVLTTTVAPMEVRKAPHATDSWSQFKPALASVVNRVDHWVLPVLRSVLLISIVFALAELCVATGRHSVSYRQGSADGPALVFRVLRDTFAQWMMGMALLIAAWVLSIILAPYARSYAETALHYVNRESFPLTELQIVLCCICLVVCTGRATCLSHQESEKASFQEGNEPTREELRPIKSSLSDSDLETQAMNSDEQVSPSLLCMGIMAGMEAILLSVERPLAAWALGNSAKSFFAIRLLLGLLPWSYMAPKILFYTPSSPYELMIPVACGAFLIGGMLVMAKRKQL